MQEQILYFEDDIKLAEVIINFLESENYQVLHYSTMPRGGVDELMNTVNKPPFVVLMDVRLDNNNGFDICYLFKRNEFFKKVPIIFMSALIGEDDILRAYEAGAYDYLIKPVKLATLSAKFGMLAKFNAHTAELLSQVSTSELVAFDAMTISSELGGILRFHEQIAHLVTFELLADELVKQVVTFGISASVMFDGIENQGIYRSDDGKVYELEKTVFKMLKGQGRVYCWGHRAIFNYDKFSVLVRSMPIDDEMREGTLKDQLCLLLNGVQSRVRGIYNENQLKRNEDNIRNVAQTIGKLVVDLQNSNLSLSEQFEKVVHELEVDIGEDLANLNLLQSEEAVLMGHINRSTKQAATIFEVARDKDAKYTNILLKLLEKLPQ